MNSGKVFILTEGGKNIGFGHVTRCIALYQALEERGIESELIINSDDTVRDLLKYKNYRLLNWLKQKPKFFKSVKNARIIIIDSYLAGISIYKTLADTANLPIYIDDTKRLTYPRGIVVNGSIYAERLHYPKGEEKTYLLGIKYIPLRKVFWDAPKKVINKNISNILITFGGMKNPVLASGLMRYLKNEFNFKFTTVDNAKRTDAARMRDLMMRSDVCISGGGQTTYELARCGVPAIGVSFADNQLLNLRGWVKEGCLKFAGWHNDKNLFKKIKDALKILDYEKRVEMSLIGQKLVDGKGANRFARKVLSLNGV